MGMAQGRQGLCSCEAGKRQRWGLGWRGRGGVGQGSPHRLDVSVQEAHGVDGLDGFQDLLAQPQGGAQREGASGLAPAQVSQVPALAGGATLLSRHRHHHWATLPSLTPKAVPTSPSSRGRRLPSPRPHHTYTQE